MFSGVIGAPLTALKMLLMVLATGGLLLSTSRSNITDSSFCCTFSSPRAEKKDFVICREGRRENLVLTHKQNS